MATRVHTTPASTGRRRLPVLPATVSPIPGTPRPRRAPTPAAFPLPVGFDPSNLQPQPADRARVEALVSTLIDWLDAQDAALVDIEPDHDGEADADEASAQPLPHPPVIIRFPRPSRLVLVTWGPR